MYQLQIKTIPSMTLRIYPDRPLFSGGENFSYDYASWWQRVEKAANILASLGVQRGEHVGVISFNTHRYFELYFAIPCYGAVMHTINPSLNREHLIYTIEHAGDRVIFVEPALFPVLEKILPELGPKTIVLLADDGKDEYPSYENMIDDAGANFDFPDLDENTPAALCYTTGTTGRPKGVHYTHRSTYLHAMLGCMRDSYGIAADDTIICVTPMFYNYGWGWPYMAAFTGARLVFPGENFTDPAFISDLIESTRATLINMVPVLLRSLGRHAIENDVELGCLRLILTGGGPPDPSTIRLFRERWGVNVLNAMGECETQSAIGLTGRIKPELATLGIDEQLVYQAKQGLPIPGSEIRVVNKDGHEVEWNDEEIGELIKKGPCMFSGYFGDSEPDVVDKEGWFHTGDMVTVDPQGYCRMRDRLDDLVKSGGEWISTVDLENVIMEMPQVREACVIRIDHETWGERPLALIVKDDDDLMQVEVKLHISERLPTWWVPDDIVFTVEIPRTSVGKFDKKKLRDKYKNYLLPPDNKF